MNAHTQTRGRSALARVRVDAARERSTRQRSLAVVLGFWCLWSGLLFLRMYRDANAVSAQNLVIAVLTLGVGWFILRAYRKAAHAKG